MPKGFEGLRERLLRAGIGGARARRYIAELKEHLEDLVAEERRAGRSPSEAQARAVQRLGDTDALAEAMIAHGEFRAWSARAPVTAYVVTPAIILTVAVALWVAAIVATCNGMRSAAGEPAEVAAWVRPVADGAAWLSNATLAILLGWGLVASAVRQRAPVLWPLLGLVVLAALGAALQVDLTLPAGGAHGEVNLRPGLNGPLLAPSGYGMRFAVDLLATVAPYTLLTQWRSAVLAEGRVG
jgi:hypothetical protein